MSRPAFLHAMSALREELGDRVIRALGDEHVHPRAVIANRAILARCDGTLREHGAQR